MNIVPQAIQRMIEDHHHRQQERLATAIADGNKLLAHFQARERVDQMLLGLSRDVMVMSTDSNGTILDYGCASQNPDGSPGQDLTFVGGDLAHKLDYNGVAETLHKHRKTSPEAAALYDSLVPHALAQWLVDFSLNDISQNLKI